MHLMMKRACAVLRERDAVRGHNVLDKTGVWYRPKR